MVASSDLKAFVSRLRDRLGTSTLTSAKGFLLMCLCRAAQLNTLREAASQTSRTVWADRFSETNPTTHERAASSVIPLAPMSAKSRCICKKDCAPTCDGIIGWLCGFNERLEQLPAARPG